MDREQHELQFLGFFGTLKQTFKIIFSRAKIFSRISLAVILPLSILYLAHDHIANLIFPEIDLGYSDGTRRGSAGFWIFSFFYFTILLLLTLIAIAAVVFTVASLFAARPTSTAAALRAAPKAWCRLAVAFIWGFIATVVYIVVGAVIITLIVVLIGTSTGGIVVLVILSILYLAGLVYVIAVWNLAFVFSVLESTYGLSAMKRSFRLIKGKILVSGGLVFLFSILSVGVEFLFLLVVVSDVGGGIGVKILVAILSCVLLTAVILIELVAGTVIYFVCKSYHHENIDMSLLSDHLQGYLGNYVVLDKSHANNNNVQLSQNV